MGRKKEKLGSSVKIEGFFRLQIEDGPSGAIVGDSGWVKNMITDTGFQHYIVQLMGNSAGSARVSHAALGEGTAPGATGTSLESEVTGTNGTAGRKAVTFSETGSKTCQWVCTFASTDSFVTQTETIRNVGLFSTSTVGGGSIFAGNTYNTSTVATNQNVNLTYQVRFATA
jgi:hypothetical protein